MMRPPRWWRRLTRWRWQRRFRRQAHQLAQMQKKLDAGIAANRAALAAIEAAQRRLR